MSEDVRMTGLIKISSMTEEEAKAKCEEYDIRFYENTYRETLACETDDYCYINGQFYEVLELKKINIYGCKTREDNGIIEFDAIYYNGGAHWTEVVACALKKEMTREH